MTAWTAPRTWSSSETVSSSLLNVEIRDHLNYLDEHRFRNPFDYPCTIHPSCGGATTGATVQTANNCHWGRVYGSGTVAALRIRIQFTSGGNIGVAVYDSSGTGLSAVPNARLATSGSVACPAIGTVSVALGGSVSVTHGTNWFALSASTTTPQFASTTGTTIGTATQSGVVKCQTTAHPPPDPAAPTATAAVGFTMIGFPS